jgi:integrase
MDEPGLFFKPAPKAIGAALKELIATKKLANLRPTYLKSLDHYLGRFAAAHTGRTVGELTPATVEAWLAQFPTAASRATWLNRINTLLAFCRQRGYIQANPCDQIARVKVDYRSPRILTPAEVETVLLVTPTICLPYVALCLFCGIRPYEAMRLNWTDINLADRAVTVSAAASKVRHRRVVPISDRAFAILSEYPVKTGPVTPSLTTLRRFKRATKKVLGWWQADILRHTAASYLLTAVGDASKVATQLGNSPGILLSHYNGLASKADAAMFFKSPRRGDKEKS